MRLLSSVFFTWRYITGFIARYGAEQFLFRIIAYEEHITCIFNITLSLTY